MDRGAKLPPLEIAAPDVSSLSSMLKEADRTVGLNDQKLLSNGDFASQNSIDSTPAQALQAYIPDARPVRPNSKQPASIIESINNDVISVGSPVNYDLPVRIDPVFTPTPSRTNSTSFQGDTGSLSAGIPQRRAIASKQQASNLDIVQQVQSGTPKLGKYNFVELQDKLKTQPQFLMIENGSVDSANYDQSYLVNPYESANKVSNEELVSNAVQAHDGQLQHPTMSRPLMKRPVRIKQLQEQTVVDTVEPVLDNQVMQQTNSNVARENEQIGKEDVLSTSMRGKQAEEAQQQAQQTEDFKLAEVMREVTDPVVVASLESATTPTGIRATLSAIRDRALSMFGFKSKDVPTGDIVEGAAKEVEAGTKNSSDIISDMVRKIWNILTLKSLRTGSTSQVAQATN